MWQLPIGHVRARLRLLRIALLRLLIHRTRLRAGAAKPGWRMLRIAGLPVSGVVVVHAQ
jgi:hypothetical protein